MKLDRVYINFTIALSAAAALYLISGNWKHQLVLDRIFVKGDRILTRDEIKSLAGVDSGALLFKISLAAVRDRIEKNPYVKRVVVVRQPPYYLSVNITERYPVALIATANNAMFSVDREGIVLPLPLKRKANLPLITNVNQSISVGDTAKGMLKEGVELINDAMDLSHETGNDIVANISEVRLSNEGLILYTTAPSVQVIVGKGDFHRKLVYLQAFLSQVTAQGQFSCRYVDLRFDGQVVVNKASKKTLAEVNR
ncbi:MAG: cell division protein FtsQ/DivIB [Candidatus Kryptoniota bacterium]